jgi:hypothetical protein
MLMASVPTSIPSDKLSRGAFREIGLRRFTRPEDLSALRHLGDLLLEMAGETSIFWPRSDESFIRTDLRAAAADLRHVSWFLTEIFEVYEAGELELEPDEEALSRFAGKVAADLARLAESIEKRLKE